MARNYSYPRPVATASMAMTTALDLSRRVPNTEALVMNVAAQGHYQPLVLLRPDQRWMIPRLREDGVPYVLAEEIHIEVSPHRV